MPDRNKSTYPGLDASDLEALRNWAETRPTKTDIAVQILTQLHDTLFDVEKRVFGVTDPLGQTYLQAPDPDLSTLRSDTNNLKNALTAFRSLSIIKHLENYQLENLKAYNDRIDMILAKLQENSSGKSKTVKLNSNSGLPIFELFKENMNNLTALWQTLEELELLSNVPKESYWKIHVVAKHIYALKRNILDFTYLGGNEDLEMRKLAHSLICHICGNASRIKELSKVASQVDDPFYRKSDKVVKKHFK